MAGAGGEMLDASLAEELLGAHADATATAVLVVRCGDDIELLNERFTTCWHVPREACSTLSSLVTWLAAHGGDSGRLLLSVLRDHGPRSGEMALPDARVLRYGVVPVRGGRRLITFTDVTAARQFEAGSRDAGSFLRLLEAHLDGALLQVDHDGRIVGMFADARGCFSQHDAVLTGRTLSEAIGKEAAGIDDVVREVFATSRPGTFDYTLERGGSERNFTARVIHLPSSEYEAPRATVLVRDVTERVRMQIQLVEAERLASVGLLAAGVAHEINNPLAYALLNLERIQSGLRSVASGEPSASREAFDTLLGAVNMGLEGCRRVKAIVNDLLYFSRNDRAENPVPVDVRRALDFAVEVAEHEIRQRATIVREFGDVPLVIASEWRLSQVFLNLLVNAVQAIPDGQPDENEIRLVTRTDADGRAVVEVHDTGVGMVPAVRTRIFDPFFTTKTGTGTGLGLTLCQRIATMLGGQLAVESTLGRGSVFRLVLPPATPENHQP